MGGRRGAAGRLDEPVRGRLGVQKNPKVRRGAVDQNSAENRGAQADADPTAERLPVWDRLAANRALQTAPRPRGAAPWVVLAVQAGQGRRRGERLAGQQERARARVLMAAWRALRLAIRGLWQALRAQAPTAQRRQAEWQKDSDAEQEPQKRRAKRAARPAALAKARSTL